MTNEEIIDSARALGIDVDSCKSCRDKKDEDRYALVHKRRRKLEDAQAAKNLRALPGIPERRLPVAVQEAEESEVSCRDGQQTGFFIPPVEPAIEDDLPGGVRADRT